MERYFCDCCGKELLKKEVQRHHLIPSKLRDCHDDNVLQVDLCRTCHVDYHKAVNFNDVSGHTKQYFIKKYIEYRALYAKYRREYLEDMM